MKKLVVTVVGLLCGASLFAFEPNSYMAKTNNTPADKTQKVEKTYSEPSTFSGHFGLGLRAGFAQNDPKDMKDYYDVAFDEGYTEKDLSRNAAVFGLEGFYEWDMEEENNKIGVKLGVDFYGQNKLKVSGSTDPDLENEKATEDTYALPLTVYYKRDNGVKNFSWFAGAGVTLIRSEVEEKGIDGWVGHTSTHKSKIFPHLTAGVEYRFSRLFALGLDVKYNIAAKVEKDDFVLSDRSGIGAALTGRFYF